MFSVGDPDPTLPRANSICGVNIRNDDPNSTLSEWTCTWARGLPHDVHVAGQERTNTIKAVWNAD